MYSIKLFLVIFQLMLKVLCDSFHQEYNLTFTNFNVSFKNGISLISTLFPIHIDSKYNPDSFASTHNNGTHENTFKNFTITALWTYAFNWFSNSTSSSSLLWIIFKSHGVLIRMWSSENPLSCFKFIYNESARKFTIMKVKVST